MGESLPPLHSQQKQSPEKSFGVTKPFSQGLPLAALSRRRHFPEIVHPCLTLELSPDLFSKASTGQGRSASGFDRQDRGSGLGQSSPPNQGLCLLSVLPQKPSVALGNVPHEILDYCKFPLIQCQVADFLFSK